MPRTLNRERPPELPAGLGDAFKLIAFEATSADAHRYASKVYPHAERIVSVLRTTESGLDVAMEKELTAAALAMFPQKLPQDAMTPELAGEAGFHVGFAVCWLFMASINGGAR